jgi:hypothetical protein
MTGELGAADLYFFFRRMAVTCYMLNWVRKAAEGPCYQRSAIRGQKNDNAG